MSDVRDPEAPPEYRVYRTPPRLLSRGPRPGESLLDDLRRERAEPGPRRRRRPVRARRVLLWVVLALVGWLALSLVLFLVSAAVQGNRVGASARAALDHGGPGLVSPTTTLVLGSDRRARGTHEPGASTTGPSRADSIVLVRSGGGHAAKLSIPRDTVVDIPGHGRDKINAAYAFGGAALMVRTVKQYLGIEVNHVFEVSFENFPALIDAMGGVDYTGSCVVSRINGGFRNGGYTLHLKAGTTRIHGKQALALARTRKNLCNPRESDLTRARRQQKILAAMRSRVFSLSGFVRLPLISWNVPKSVRSDMGGPSLLAYAVSNVLSGSPSTRVLRPSGGVTLPGGGAGLVVSDAERQAEVRRFLR
jgi:LCP family protein required for cell wall assembly